MKRINKTKIIVPLEPTPEDDFTIRLIRSGASKADKNFLLDDPRFSPEAMEERRNKQSLQNRREWRSHLLEKYGK